MKRLNRVDRLINWETAFLTYHVLLSIGARDGIIIAKVIKELHKESIHKDPFNRDHMSAS